MDIHWDMVKKKTLWQYEELIEKLLEVLEYSFVQEYYNHDMRAAEIYSEKIRQHFLQNGREATFLREITRQLRVLGDLGIRNYLDLVQRVESRAKCEAFLQTTGFRFDELIEMLNYLFRWVLPFKCPIKELVDTDDARGRTYLEILRKQGVKSNLDVLENYRTRMRRTELARASGLTESFILEQVHRADISRLAYARGKTVKHLCGGGYDTLDKLANAHLEKMADDMKVYYKSIGKDFSDFKAAIPLDWMVGGAKVLPRVVEE